MINAVVNKKIIAIDLGGTKTSAAIADNKGKISDFRIFSTPFNGGIIAVEDLLFNIAHEYKDKYSSEICGVGIAASGRVDSAAGKIIAGVPLCEGYIGFAPGRKIADELNLPVGVFNDANAAAFAEYKIGAGGKAKRLVCITIGTGIGGGIVINGELISGFGNAGEIGHIIIEKGGIKCGCGGAGCLEKYVSRKIIAEKISDAIKKGLITNAAYPAEINSEFIMTLINQKEPHVMEIFESALESLAVGIENLINIIDPDLILLSGQLSELGDTFINSLKNKIRYDVNIQTAELKNNAGIIGAALLCFNDYIIA